MTTVTTKNWWMLDLSQDETHDDDCDNEELVDVGLVPERETHDDDCDNEELVDVGLVPGRDTR